MKDEPEPKKYVRGLRFQCSKCLKSCSAGGAIHDKFVCVACGYFELRPQPKEPEVIPF